MKSFKITMLIVVLCLISLFASSLFAATTAEIYCTVIIQNLSVSLSGSNYAFLSVAAGGGSAPTGQAITVTNDGNVTETYDLKLAYTLTGSGTAWTPVTTAPIANQFRLSAIFGTATNASGNYDGAVDAITTVDQTSTTAKFAKDNEGAAVKGYGVTASATRTLDFFFEAPASTDVTAQQFITVTITATAT